MGGLQRYTSGGSGNGWVPSEGLDERVSSSPRKLSCLEGIEQAGFANG